MIQQLRGTVIEAGATTFTIDVGGVGFKALTTPSTAAGLRLGDTTTVHTSLVVREDSMTLFGFDDPGERDAFELVQTAAGVGPKLAVAIVSVLSPSELRRAVSSEDLARLCTVPGIGRKGAQKLVIELKDKVLLLANTADEPKTLPSTTEVWREQVSEGLQGLGWSARDASTACDNVAHLVEAEPSTPIGSLMRSALNSLAKKR